MRVLSSWMSATIAQAGVAICVLLHSQLAFGQTRNLDFYLNTALHNSPLLKEFQNQATANGLDSLRLRATYRPQVAGVANNSYSPIINGWGYDAALSNVASINDWVNVNQAFVSRKNLNTQLYGVGLVSDSFLAAKKMTEQDLKRTVTAQYITAFGDQQQLKFYSETRELLRTQDSILKKLTQANAYKQTDYLTFLVTMRQQELTMKQLQIQFRNDYAQLCYLCGIFDTAAATLDTPGLALQQLPDTGTSVFFMRYRINDLLLSNDISILNYSYRPKLNAFGNAGYSSSLQYEPYKNFGFSLGMSLNVPIYDGHQRKILTDKIKLQQNSNSGYRDFFSRQYDQQLAMLRQQLYGTESLIGDINDQIKYSKGLIDINGRLLGTGDVKISDFVIAINNYLTAKNLLTQNSISRLQIINQINYWNR